MRSHASASSVGSMSPSPPRARRLGRALGSALLALLLVPALASAAVPAHPFLEAFGSAAQPSFGSAAGMAVDPANGDLYVIDLQGQTLQRFKENGEPQPFSALAGNTIDGHAGEADEVSAGPKEIFSNEGAVEFGEPTPAEVEVAIAPPGSAGGTAGDIYVTDAWNERIVIFAPTGAYLGQEAIGYDCGVAVGPGGEVFVGDFSAGVHKLEPTAPGSFTEAPGSPFAAASPCQIAVGSGSSAGYVFATSFQGPIHKLNATSGAEEYVVDSGGHLTATVDPASGHVYTFKFNQVFEGEVAEFDASGATEATEVSRTPIIGGFEGHGLAVNGSTGNFYVTPVTDPKVEVYAPIPPSFALTIDFGGSGTGTVQCDTGSGFGPCEPEYAEGTAVTIKDTPALGSAFVAWNGECDSLSGDQCEVTIDAAKTVEAINDQVFSLTVWITGQGSVTSSPAGLLCAGEECSGQFAGNVELTAHPATGYTFAGWLGCKHTAAGKCEVNVTAASEVTAVFLAEGAQGPTGPGGPTGPTGPGGPTGPTGPVGPTGPAGQKGANGANGQNGAQGPAGPSGPAGAQGPQGKQGPAGKVTCKVKQNGTKVKVTCTVKQSASASKLHWRLMRAGHTYSHGATRDGRLDLGNLRPGHYQLHLQGQKGATRILIG